MKKARIIIISFLFLFLLGGQTASAFEIKVMDNMPVEHDLILGPGKVELLMTPGQSVTKEMTLTNRTGEVLDIKIEIEDFTGDSVDSTKLLGLEKGPYSLRNYLEPEKREFRLSHAEKATLPIKINIPANAEPGGLYGAVIVRAQPASKLDDTKVDGAKGQVSVVPRLAELFFVRIAGETKEEGALKSFETDKKFYQGPPVNFSVDYTNTGKVHLNPYAEIEINNFLGRKIDNIEVAPWFVMPGFSRTRVVPWERSLAFGYYTAHLKLHRGYSNLIDESTISFWIIPLKVLLIAIAVIIFISLFFWWFSSKFELKKKN